MKKLFLTIVIMIFLSCPAYAENVVPISKIPIDIESTGSVPDPSGYTDEWVYTDPTISVSIETGSLENCNYWIADIVIADASQLRTVAAGGFSSSGVATGTRLAQRVNAVFAINGDYFCYTGSGYILRQGIEYKNILNGDRDVLLIDEDGDFHVFYNAAQGDVGPEINGKRSINAFYFGPVLVDHGKKINEPFGSNMAYNEGRQRMAICQAGPLHYKVVCCDGPSTRKSGLTLDQFASLLESFDVDIAYNLDGGDSTMMIFRNKKINDIRNANTRKINDIIYFASAAGMLSEN